MRARCVSIVVDSVMQYFKNVMIFAEVSKLFKVLKHGWLTGMHLLCAGRVNRLMQERTWRSELCLQMNGLHFSSHIHQNSSKCDLYTSILVSNILILLKMYRESIVHQIVGHNTTSGSHHKFYQSYRCRLTVYTGCLVLVQATSVIIWD